MLHVVHSNRTEALAEALERILAQPLPSPLAPEVVVVPTQAVGRWLTLRIAERMGVCANIRFLYPANFIWEMFRLVLGGNIPVVAPFSPEVNAWRVFSELGALPEDESYAPVRHYLRESDTRRRYELAERIAECFDQYLIFRPDWVRAWESGRESHWQAGLWRRVVADRRPLHWVHALDAFTVALAASPDGKVTSNVSVRAEPVEARTDVHPSAKLRTRPSTLLRANGVEHRRASNLPERVSLFAVSALSPTYLDVIAQLARHLQVHMLLLNPCRQYWGDIVSPRVQATAGEEASAGRYLETGNRLLAALGRPGRDFIDRVLEIEHVEEDRYDEPAGASLLHALQADILDLRARGSRDTPSLTVAAHDRSIQVHACHSPMREVEVLHDQLLAMFEQWPDLRPSDILVAATDSARYAPYIAAVFAAADDARRIPVDIAAGNAGGGDLLTDALFALLALPESRLGADEVLAPLEVPALQRRFDLSDDDLLRVHRWVEESGIRWGWDAAQRAELGVPATTAHTWRAGIDRLLLGYALADDDERLYAGVLPHAAVEGSLARTLSRLLEYLDALLTWRARLAVPKRVSEWGQVLTGLLEAFFAPEDAEEDLVQDVRDALAALVHDAQLGGCRERLSVAIIADVLRDRLSGAGQGRVLLRGGVCFAELGAVRSLPFGIVCVLGMDDTVFPRPDRHIDFDLLAGQWRRGDRSRRDEDRYLFLETLLSARRCLYLSYVGNDIRTNATLPPSVLVSELLDEMERGSRMQTGGTVSAQVLTRHPLQAFSPRYFRGEEPHLFSYRDDLCIAPPAVASGRPPLVSAPLPFPVDRWREIEVRDLLKFYRHPVRFFLEQRLGLRLRESGAELEVTEPFALGNFAADDLRQRLTRSILAGNGAAQREVEMARGVLPQGAVGEQVYRAAERDAVAFAELLAERAAQSVPATLGVELEIAGVRVIGTIDGVQPVGLFEYRAVDELYPRQRIEFWLRHLLLHAAAPERAGVSELCTLNTTLRLAPPRDARRELADLLALLHEGLCRPLHLFPRTTVKYMHASRGDKDALKAARAEWEGSTYVKGEGEDLCYRLAFGDTDPLDAEFETLARRVLTSLFAHEQEAT